MTNEGKLSLVEQALYAGWIETPKNQIVRTDRWAQLTTPGVKGQLQNGVFRSLLGEAEVQPRIESMIAHYRSLGLPFWWVVTPSTEPASMAARLAENGFRHRHTSIAMLASPADIRVALEPDTTVELVNEANLDEWLAVQAQGWGTGPAGLEAARSGVKRRIAKRSQSRVDMLVRASGVAAGAGSIQFFERSAHLFGGVVLPAFRKRGLFRARTAASLELILQRGIPHVTTHAIRETSAPIYRRMGFEEVCEITYHEHE